MDKTKVAVCIVALCVFSVITLHAWAGDLPVNVKESSQIKDVLKDQMGKRVTVKTDSGEAMEGQVVMVGDQLVRLGKLSGKDFFDAFIKIDRISSVIVKARN
jgi:hypothetical protein